MIWMGGLSNSAERRVPRMPNLQETPALRRRASSHVSRLLRFFDSRATSAVIDLKSGRAFSACKTTETLPRTTVRRKVSF